MRSRARRMSTRFSILPTSRLLQRRPLLGRRLPSRPLAKSPRCSAACPRTSRRFLVFCPERTAFGQLVDVALDSLRLAGKKFFHRVCELGMTQPVRRPRGARHESPCELVLALCAPLEDTDAALYAELQRLVIADLEMQQRHVADRAPVAAVQHERRENIEGARDRLSIELGKHHHEVFGKRLAEPPEELQIEIGRRVMRAVRVVVAAREKAPVLVADFGSCQPPHLHARFPYPPPLLADFLALRRGEIGEKLVEIRVATVFP